MKKNPRETLLALARPLIDAQGLELWGLDIIPGPVLKAVLYVDAPLAKQGGDNAPSANIDQCESISRGLSLAMDVEDCIDQPWSLEVSSPGLERKFFALEQMRPYVGDILEVRLVRPLAGTNRKNWRGRLLSVDSDSFELEPASISAEGGATADGDLPARIQWNDAAKIRRLHIFATPARPGKKPGKKQ